MIHQYKLNGYNVVLDVVSGAVHVVDDVVYDYIKMFDNKTNEDEIKKVLLEKFSNEITEQDIVEIKEDVDELISGGKLFAEDDFMPLAKKYTAENKVVKALCLHISHTCNLTCDYCFAKGGKYHGDDALMSFEVGKRALDFLIENSGARHNLEVDFFGGEPLMNWETVKRLVEYARSIEKQKNKNFRFTLTTNGVLLNDEIGDYLNKEMDNVVLSLDGRKAVHDRLRRTVNGKGSYDIIVPKFQKFVESRGNKGYYVRGTFTHENVDFLEDILHMADLGFSELSMEPVVCSKDDPHAITQKDMDIVFEQYENLAKEMLKREKQGKGFTFYHYMLDLKSGPCVYKRVTGCGSGTEYMAVTPWGDLYPCHQFVGDKKYLMGNVFTGVENTGIRDEMASCTVYDREECKDCWARMYCSGGCAANSYHATGSVKGVYAQGCDLFKKRMECAIMMEVDRAQDS